jgi:putative ABC transport system permease protein
MLRNYYKAMLRTFIRNKWYAGVNLFGLSLGFAAFILIVIYLHHETHFEQFHTKSDRIYRVTWFSNQGKDFSVEWARIPYDFINEFPEYMPEIQTQVRFQNQEKKYLRIGQEKFTPKHAYVTDKEVFQVFDFKLIYGDPGTALAAPKSIVLTHQLARKYFGKTNPIGQYIAVTSPYSSEEVPYEVTGVMQDLPTNTHLPVDMLFSYRDQSERRSWAYVYMLLNEGEDIENVKAKVPDFLLTHMEVEKEELENMGIRFQALPDIHLTSDLAREIIPNGNSTYVYFFYLVGFFILAIALINFINLSTALSMQRSKEMGIRKILGAAKKQQMTYAFAESIAYNIIALMLGAGMAFLIYPAFKMLTVLELTISITHLGLLMLGVAILGGLLSGIYPALILNSIDPLNSIKSTSWLHLTNKKIDANQWLIGGQFCVAFILIVATLIGFNQVQYLNKKDLGYNYDQILAIPGVPDVVTSEYAHFKEQLKTIPGVSQVAACMQVPSEEIRDAGPVFKKGETEDQDKALMMDIQVIDSDFIDLMDIQLLAGQVPTHEFTLKAIPEFSEDFTFADYLMEQKRTYLINETAMEMLGWKYPEEVIGQEINWSIGNLRLADGPVAGVVKNFHQESLKNKIDPLVLVFEPIWLKSFLVKMPSDEVASVLPEITDIWNSSFPTYPFEYLFLDDLFNRLYKAESTQLILLSWFSILSIFIASLGLFAMLAFNLRRRMKEIAIRKILGASLGRLIGLVGKQYLQIVVLSVCMAIPFSYWGINNWLERFAYRVEVSILPYLLAVCIILIILLAIIAWQTYLHSKMNPTQYLQEE